VSRVVLDTERLRLREFRTSDLRSYAGMLGDPETMRYYPRPFTSREARGFIEKNRHRYAANGFGVWVIEERDTRAFLGDCGLAFTLVEGVAEVEIIWHVVRGRWRQGIASEAAAAVRDHAFGPLQLHRLVALVRPENVPSAGVARKIGMDLEREAVFHDLPHLVFASTPGPSGRTRSLG
jgi:[ribosomal protein S5]-alanine N-acetyltransferase